MDEMPETLPKQHFVIRYQFFIIFALAALILEVPFISIPLKWFESFFHEISHGLAAVATGGDIIRIQLFTNGAGLCTTQGGVRLIVSFMGYAGASIWGYLIFRIAGYHQVSAKFVSGTIIGLLIICMLFWVSDLLTMFILAILMAILALKLLYSTQQFTQYLIQIIGATILLNSVKSPLYLLDGRSLGDGATLDSLTFVPEIFWVAIWCGIGMISIYFLAKQKRF